MDKQGRTLVVGAILSDQKYLWAWFGVDTVINTPNVISLQNSLNF